MATTYSPFGGYLAVSGVIVPATQALIIGEINKLKALIPNIANSESAVHPDFDQIDPHTAEKIRAEITALTVAIDASVTS